MLSLQEIESYYPAHLRPFKRFMIREFLQHKLLEIIFDSEFADKLCFLGGTCLRIVHGNERFSEDLDFDNFNLSETHFGKVTEIIKKELQREGYNIEVKKVIKGAFHCYIRFPGILFQEGLTGHREEKILIQLDTEPQHFDFEPESYILNKFSVFTNIYVSPLDLLLAQKFYAIINRKRKKGRDFFDVVFLLGKTKPNYDYLDLKLGLHSEKQLKDRIMDVCEKTNMKDMARDVAPFLFNARDEKKILAFPDYINAQLDA